jgi:hypothetical protein
MHFDRLMQLVTNSVAEVRSSGRVILSYCVPFR